MTTRRFFAVFFALFLLSSTAQADCPAGCWFPESNHCACGGSRSSGGGSSSGSSNFSGMFSGNVAKNGFKQAMNCGNPLCFAFQGTATLLAAAISDVPYYAVKAPIYLVKGLGKGAVMAGHGLAATGKAIGKAAGAPGRKRAAKNSAIANSTAAHCSGASGDSFDAYRTWEDCKRAVLKRQKAMTKINPSNKENEKWCKGHLPLSSGPNRMNWEARCNPGGGEKLVEAPQVPAASQTAAAVGSNAAANAPSGATGSAAAPGAASTNAKLTAAAEAMANVLASPALAGETLSDSVAEPAAAERPAGSEVSAPTVPPAEPNFDPLQPGSAPSVPAGASAGVPLTPFSQTNTAAGAASPELAGASSLGQAWDGNAPNTDDPLIQLAQLTGRMPVPAHAPQTPSSKPASGAVSRDSGNYDAAAVSGAGRTVSSTKPEEKERPLVVMMSMEEHWKNQLARIESQLPYLYATQANEALGNLLSMGAAKINAPVKEPIRLTIPRELLTRAARRERDGLPEKTPDTPANETIALSILNAHLQRANLKNLLAQAKSGGGTTTSAAQWDEAVGARQGAPTGAFTVVISAEPTVGGSSAAQAASTKPACAKKTVQSEQWILVPEAAGKNASGQTLYKEVFRRLPLTVELNFCD